MIKKKFAILVSGYGRGAIQIIKDCRNGLIKPQLSLLVSSNPNSESLKYASSNNIPYAVIEKDKFETKSEFETEIKSLLFNHGIDYVFLAGWMPIIGPSLINNYIKRIINIHPSLLPSFKGLNAIDQAINSGVKVTGITTHFVNHKIDSGEIIDQIPVVISSSDDFNSLVEKIFKAGVILTRNTINNNFI